MGEIRAFRRPSKFAPPAKPRHCWPFAGKKKPGACPGFKVLVVGELDGDNLPANRQVLERLDCPRELAVVAGASRGFEEPGKLDEAGQILVRWFGRWLAAAPVSQPDNLA